MEAGLNIAPGGLFVLGLGTLAHGFIPRHASTVAYAAVAWSFLVELVGAIVRANHWLLDTSLFHHIAPAPAAPPRWDTAVVLVTIGALAAAAGAARFARRDVVTA